MTISSFITTNSGVASTQLFGNTQTTVNLGNWTNNIAAGTWLVACLGTDNVGLVNGDTDDHLALSIVGTPLIKLKEYTNTNGVVKTGATISMWLVQAPAGGFPASFNAIVVTTRAPVDAFALTCGRCTAPNLAFRGLAGDYVGAATAGAPWNVTMGPSGGPTSQHLAIRADAIETDVLGSNTPTPSPWVSFSGINSGGGSGRIYIIAEGVIESTAQSTSTWSIVGGGSTSRRASIGVVLAETYLGPGKPKMLI